jgi:ubiquinone/menaquinone biosynthesis C-methylase UbiE
MGEVEALAEDVRERSNAGLEGETQRILRLYEREAPKYDREMRCFELLLFGGGPEWVCSQAEGEVLEIAVGTGRNLPHYRDGVRLTGVELSPAMLAIARARARDLGRDVDLRVGDAQALDFPDECFDSVVSTLSLCTIPDERAAVAEVRRVLRPGGRFLLLEHVRSPVLPIRLAERLLEPLMCRFKGDHLLREPVDHLHAEDFVVEWIERSKLGIVERVAARKPADAAAAGESRGSTKRVP